MNRKLKDEDMDILFRGILKLQTVEDCYDFFEDLCTIAELRAMVQRFQVARMLDEGRIYSDIVQETGASTRDDQPREQVPCVRLGRLPQDARPAQRGRNSRGEP